MDKISKVFSKIMEDPNLQQELAKKQTIEDIYEFCLSISDGYTMEEFQAYLKDLIKMVGGMSEEKLEKVSGGVTWNNKALSAVLATMSLASPLAGAAGTTPEQSNQTQPSAISSFAGKIKKVVTDNPITSALNGTVVAGLGVLALLKGHGKSEQPQPNDPTNANPQPQQPQVRTTDANILQGINIQNLRQSSEVTALLNGVSNAGVLTPTDLHNRCVGAIGNLPVARSFVTDVMNALRNISRDINLANMDHFSFFRQSFLGTNSNNQSLYNNVALSDADVLKIDTSDPRESLGDIRLAIRQGIFGDPFNVEINADEMAVVIRYMQAKYLEFKSRL